MPAEEADGLVASINADLESKYALTRSGLKKKMERSEWLENHWKGIKSMQAKDASTFSTAVDSKELQIVGEAIASVPENFNVHRGVRRVLDKQRAMFETGEGIDWGTAEALAFGTLLREGFHVRLSGQDCERGTFSHRHAVLIDQKTEEEYVRLKHLDGVKGEFSVCNSNLSEFACLGFELGFSLEHPNCLVLWEAQFGDFVNGAQIIIDNFLSSGEQKWWRQSGLTMLLPHGYDGQGPEHSSARLERFLQLCDDNPYDFPAPEMVHRQEHLINMQVVNLTTPANYFHCLRRQLQRQWRKPLIVMSPKSLLRAPFCVSSRHEFTSSEFQRLIRETSTTMKPDDEIRRVILCSGKVYYDLVESRAAQDINDIAILRVEQIAPFPFDLVATQLARYPSAEVVWCQEESMNSGSWTYVRPRIQTALRHISSAARVRYVGRNPSAAPATGSAKLHAEETKRFLGAAMGK